MAVVHAAAQATKEDARHPSGPACDLSYGFTTQFSQRHFSFQETSQLLGRSLLRPRLVAASSSKRSGALASGDNRKLGTAYWVGMVG